MSVDVDLFVAEATRELRLRARIDALLDRCARKERYILRLEDVVRRQREEIERLRGA